MTRRRPPSSKSLFRATSGKGKRTGNEGQMFNDLPDQARPADARREHDFYPTGHPKRDPAFRWMDRIDARQEVLF